MKKRLLGTWFSLALITLLLPPLHAGSEGDPKHETPVSSQSIPLRLGAVDAVTGNLSLRVPLGPRLPGRIPLGFTWAYDYQDALLHAIGGNFKPVVWPGGSSSPLSVSVVVNGEQWMFYKQAAPATGAMPTQAELLALYSALGVDSGEAEANAQNTPNSLISSPQWTYTIAPSTDGQRFFISSYWKIGWVNIHGGDSIKNVAGRDVVLDGPRAIWTALQADLVHFTGVSYFTNRWGDKVSVTETGGQNGAPTSIQIRNELHITHTITLSISGLVGTSGPCVITVNNSLGLPVATLAASNYAMQERSTYVPPGSPGPGQPAGIWDAGVQPVSLCVGPSGGPSICTSFTWDTDNGQKPRLRQLVHPGGMTEHFDYDWNVSRLSNDAYDPTTGYWRGYKVMELENCGLACYWPLQVVNRDDYDGVCGIQITGSGFAQSTAISRLLPTGQKSGQFSWGEKRHITSILSFANGAGTGSYRGIRIYHSSVDSWSATGNTSVSAYLFAASSIVGTEQIHGSTRDSSGQPSGYTVDSVELHDGWSLKSWANPSGGLGNGLPVNPVARRIRTDATGLPTKTIIAGASGGEDAFGPTTTDEFTDLPGSTLPSVDTTSAPIWSSGLSLPSSPVHRHGSIHRVLDRSLWALETTDENKSLDGGQSPTLRYDGNALPGLVGVGSVDFGTTSYTYDAAGLKKVVTGARGSFTSTETRSYGLTSSNGNPLPLLTQTLKGLSGYLPNPVDTTVQVGTAYQYDGSSFQWLTGEKDLADGRWTTYLRDDLGRETQVTDRLGVVTTTAYDNWGRVGTVTRQAKGRTGGVKTEYFYDPNGLWKEVSVTGAGTLLTARTDYDVAGRIVGESNYQGYGPGHGGAGPLISSRTTGYDGWGQKVSQSPWIKAGQSSYGNFTWDYDDLGRATASHDRVGSSANPNGRLLSQVTLQPAYTTITGSDGVSLTGVATTVQEYWNDPQGRSYTRTEVHDLLGQKAGVIDQKGQTSLYRYDKDGHLLQTQQGNQLRSYQYNDMGWLTKRTEVEEGSTIFSNFTMLGTPLLVTQTGRSGNRSNTVATHLDNHLQPDQIQASGPEGVVTRNLAYDYGASNTHLITQLTESQPNGMLTETYGYDDLGRFSSKTLSDGTQTFTVSRTLDDLGKVLTLNYPAGGGRTDVAAYSYDALGRPATVTMNTETRPRGSMLYDQISGTSVSETLTLGNNAWTTRKTDSGELVRVTHVAPSKALEDDAIAWTAGGLMLSRGPDTFDYDALQRLASAQVFNPTTGAYVNQSFAYDRYGNRTASSTSSPAGTLAQDSEALTWSAAYTNGNDLPTAVSGLSTGAIYDDLGRLIQAWTTPGQASTQTTWVYDPSGRVVRENGTNYLLDAQGLRFRRKKADGSINYTIYGFNREPLAVWEQAAPVGVVQTLALAATPKASKKSSSKGASAKAGTVTPSIIIVEPAGAYITQPSGPIAVGIGTSVSFAGTTDFGTSFSWTFGDGATAATAATSHSFATAGSYQVFFKASASGYKTSSASVAVTVIAKPTIASFASSPSSLALGQSSTLSWSVSGATSLSISGVGSVTGTSVAVTPSATTTYTLTATNLAGSVTASTTVTLVPPVISAFSASPSSLTLGGSTTLSWSVAGAASLSISGIGAVSGSSVVVTPSATSLYTLTATNASGSVTASVTVTVNNPPPPTITSFGASATPINLGSSSTLSWSISGATSLSIDQGIGSVSGGSIGVTPTVTTTYTLTASNAWGTATRSVTVTVLPPTISSFTASPSGITLGQGSTLAWSTTYATGVSISGVGAVAGSGSTVVNPTTTTTYTLTATSSAGTTTAQVTVALAAPVINSLSATYTQITSGSGTTLVWNVTGAASLSLSPGPGTVTGNNATVFPTATTVYTLTATNAAGSVTRNITITVDGAPVLQWSKTLVYGFGQLLCEEHASGPALIYIQSDQVGSPNWITDANGALLNYTKNLPFGERLADANPNAPKSLRRFTNHEEDTDSNAIYMQAREYLAGYGKFAQVDPAYDQTKDDPESWNLYNYVTNNPVTHIDPDGRYQVVIDGLIVMNNNQNLDQMGYGNKISDGYAPPITFIGLSGGGSIAVLGTETMAPSAHTNSEPGNEQRIAKGPTAIAPGQDLTAARITYSTEEKAATAAILEIKSKYGDQTSKREFGTIIYKSKGGYYYAPIAMGPIPASGERAAVDLRVLIKENLVPQKSLITANLHTHPVNQWSGKPSGEDVIILRTSKYYSNYNDTGRQVSPRLNGYLWTNAFGRNLLSYTGSPSPDFTDGSVSRYGWIPF